VPAVVSRTPEFERTARESGVDYAVFGNERQLLAAVDRLRSSACRVDYLRVAQPAIWRAYSPEAVARRFLTIAQKYSASRTGSTVSGGSVAKRLWQGVCFRIRSNVECAGEQFPTASRVIARALWAFRNRSLKLLFRPSTQGLLTPKEHRKP
jgi:hypothetical protein